MEVFREDFRGEFGPIQVIFYHCDMCGEAIPKEHMGNSKANRDKIQVNLYSNNGKIQHFCRKCSQKLVEFVRTKTEKVG